MGPPVDSVNRCLISVAKKMVDISRTSYCLSYFMVYKPTYIWGAPSCSHRAILDSWMVYVLTGKYAMRKIGDNWGYPYDETESTRYHVFNFFLSAIFPAASSLKLGSFFTDVAVLNWGVPGTPIAGWFFLCKIPDSLSLQGGSPQLCLLVNKNPMNTSSLVRYKYNKP